MAAAKTNIAGALDWVAFDYNTTFDSESCIDFTCYHGVSDTFRIPKMAASVFSSQRDPALYGFRVQGPDRAFYCRVPVVKETLPLAPATSAPMLALHAISAAIERTGAGQGPISPGPT